MKRLSDYKNEEAIDLIADLLEPIAVIINAIRTEKEGCKTKVELVSKLIKDHKNEVKSILLRIDPTELTAINIVSRMTSFLMDMQADEDMLYFFNSAANEMENTSSGGVTETTTEEKM